MEKVLSLLLFILFLSFILGLIKPRIFLFWSQKQTRLKFVTLWLVPFCLFFALLIYHLNTQTAAEIMELARDSIGKKNYSYAISRLEKIASDDPFYAEAQSLITACEKSIVLSPEEVAAIFIRKGLETDSTLTGMRPYVVIAYDENENLMFVEYSERQSNSVFAPGNLWTSEPITLYESRNIRAVVKISTQIARKIEYRGRGAAYISIGKASFALINPDTGKCRPDFIMPVSPEGRYPERIQRSYTDYPEKRRMLVDIGRAIK